MKDYNLQGPIRRKGDSIMRVKKPLISRELEGKLKFIAITFFSSMFLGIILLAILRAF